MVCVCLPWNSPFFKTNIPSVGCVCLLRKTTPHGTSKTSVISQPTPEDPRKNRAENALTMVVCRMKWSLSQRMRRRSLERQTSQIQLVPTRGCEPASCPVSHHALCITCGVSGPTPAGHAYPTLTKKEHRSQWGLEPLIFVGLNEYSAEEFASPYSFPKNGVRVFVGALDGIS